MDAWLYSGSAPPRLRVSPHRRLRETASAALRCSRRPRPRGHCPAECPPRGDALSELDGDRFRVEGLHLQRHKRAKAPRILFAAWADPLYVAGHKTYVDDLYAITGAQNAVQVDGWPQYAIESVVASPPDILLHSSRLDVAPVFKNAPELLSHIRVVAIDENKYTRPGPHVVDAA